MDMEMRIWLTFIVGFITGMVIGSSLTGIFVLSMWG